MLPSSTATLLLFNTAVFSSLAIVSFLVFLFFELLRILFGRKTYFGYFFLWTSLAMFPRIQKNCLTAPHSFLHDSLICRVISVMRTTLKFTPWARNLAM